MFCAAFLLNSCNNLSYTLYRRFLICFALRFLANLSNYLSSILRVSRSLALCLVEHSHLGPPVVALRKAHRLRDLSTLTGMEVFWFVVPQTKNF